MTRQLLYGSQLSKGLGGNTNPFSRLSVVISNYCLFAGSNYFPDKETLFPIYLIILFIVRRLKCPRMNYTKRLRHAQSACLFNNFHVFPAQENLSFQNPTEKKSPHPPNITSPTKQHPSSPISFKLWLQVRYLFFILTKQRFENNVNFLLNILSCWHEEEGKPVYLCVLACFWEGSVWHQKATVIN